MTITLAAFARHAERFGTECVYETVEEMGFTALELGYFARHLRRIDRRWRLTTDQREHLVTRLLADGVRKKDIADMAGVSERTVSRARQQVAEAGLLGPANRMVEPKKKDKSEHPNDRPGEADFVHSGGNREASGENLDLDDDPEDERGVDARRSSADPTIERSSLPGDSP
jgi:hypothetical protein